MEKQVKILQHFPMAERQYTDRNGQAACFTSKGFKLSDGVDSFYAEMTGDMAKRCQNVTYEQGKMYCAQMQISCREFTDRDGVVRYSNEIRIINLA